MTFNKKLYLDEYTNRYRTRIMKKLRAGKLCMGIYIICVSSSEHDLLDIIPSYMMFSPMSREQLVVGIASSKEDAFELCRHIVDDVYTRTSGYDLKQYFKVQR